MVIEVVYVLTYKVSDNQGMAILGVSFAVTFLCLPLYIVAESWQNRERKKALSLKPVVSVIKAVFSGDEQYMILSAYYRQNHYHPVFSLRSSFGILIQIPFFLAAYNYLSGLESIRGIPFLFIADLGKADSSFVFKNITVNILPVAMTLINCTAGAVYTKDLGARDKVQVYGMAALFLVILYNSPAGLVLYWTMNNVLSLAKNVFYKIKRPLPALYALLSILCLVFIYHNLVLNTGELWKRLFLSGALFIVILSPILIRVIKIVYRKFLLPLSLAPSGRFLVFIISAAGLFVLSGLFIPSSVISSSPQEFSFIDSYTSPLPFVGAPCFQALGLFVFWPLCIYFLFDRKIKTLETFFFMFLFLFTLCNKVFFQGDTGNISNTFVFASNGVLRTGLPAALLNPLCALLIAAVLFLAVKKNRIRAAAAFPAVLLLALVLFSGIKIADISTEFAGFKNRQADRLAFRSIEPVFSLAKDKKNLIVVMVDGAISGFVPFIFDEHPELLDQFDGFTYYPNTVSFGTHTIFGAPPLWGGYEYTPREMNLRDTVPLVKKHNEALLVMPLILSGAGFTVTVTDPSWANYSYIPDTSIYDGYENITAFNTIKRYSSIWYERNQFSDIEFASIKIKRNALWFSLLTMAPPSLRTILYDNGWYWGTDDIGSTLTDFINNFAVLDFLPELTRYDSLKPSALLLTNETPHESRILQYPDYLPVEKASDSGSGRFSLNANYHSNSAVFLQIGQWFADLQKNGVYDNTRIIIVSDHGSGVDGLVSPAKLSIPETSREDYNPVLLVKDYNARGNLFVDGAFMTNADVPALALRGIVEKAVNPFTGREINSRPKENGALITVNHIPMAYQHGKYQFKIKNDEWVLVNDDIRDEHNWRKTEK
jgi:YidC/Oxa1 family membrane protein insertase